MAFWSSLPPPSSSDSRHSWKLRYRRYQSFYCFAQSPCCDFKQTSVNFQFCLCFHFFPVVHAFKSVLTCLISALMAWVSAWPPWYLFLGRKSATYWTTARLSSPWIWRAYVHWMYKTCSQPVCHPHEYRVHIYIGWIELAHSLPYYDHSSARSTQKTSFWPFGCLLSACEWLSFPFSVTIVQLWWFLPNGPWQLFALPGFSFSSWTGYMLFVLFSDHIKTQNQQHVYSLRLHHRGFLSHYYWIKCVWIRPELPTGILITAADQLVPTSSCGKECCLLSPGPARFSGSLWESRKWELQGSVWKPTLNKWDYWTHPFAFLT